MSKRSEPITFRLPAAYEMDLAHRSSELGESVGKYVERVVVESLTDTARDEMREELTELRRAIDALRGDFATALVALLSQKNPYTVQEAEAWVKKTFFH